jgi:hypothetical protein
LTVSSPKAARRRHLTGRAQARPPGSPTSADHDAGGAEDPPAPPGNVLATLAALTAVTGRRWTIEEDHQFGKDQFGYDQVPNPAAHSDPATTPSAVGVIKARLGLSQAA